MPHDKDGELNLTAVAPDSIVNVNDSFFTRSPDESYKKISWLGHKRNIFKTSPSVNDITQSGIGDCALLAVLLSITRKAPQRILGMMRDERGGHVVVRLYHIDTGQPIYYRLQKTYLSKKNANVTGHSAYWVYMMEKAVAYYRIAVEKYKYKPYSIVGNAIQLQDETEARTQIEALSGGKEHRLFKLLLGGNAEEIGVNIANNNVAAKFFELVSIAPGDEQKNVPLLQKVFGSEQSAEALDFVAHFNVATKLAALGGHGAFTGELGVLRRKRMAAFVDTHYNGLQPQTRQKITSYLESLFPGKRGTGQYNQHQLDLFQRITQALSAQKYVVVGSKSEVGAANEFGRSGGSIYKGLVGPHGYEVMDTKTQGTLRFIRLRNPWGHTGRHYILKNPMWPEPTLSAYKTDSGEFDLELSDLTKRFNNVYIGG